jgi:hypothetical protein
MGGFTTEIDCSSEPRCNLKLQTHPLVREDPKIKESNFLNIISKENKRKTGLVSQMLV